jgi:tRNA (pseudouridine54-N1)-methyltransferase
MREFVYYSKNAMTSGKFNTKELMRAGRMDIACQMIITAFFVSHHTREDVKLHLVFDGPPDAPKHLELFPGKNFMADDEHRIDISKRDIAGLIKRILYKYKKDMKNEVAPGYFVEKKSLIKVVEELIEQGNKVFILDKRGENVRDVKTKELKNAVFIIGDQDGIPKKELKHLKKIAKKISVGNQMYFASQTMTILQNELDIREI